MVAWRAAPAARKRSQPGGYDGDGDHTDRPNGIWPDDGGVRAYCDADSEALFAFTYSGQNGAHRAQPNNTERIVRRLPVADADTASATDEYADATSATNGHANAASNRDRYADTNTNANRDGHTDTNTNANGDGYADTDANTNGDCDEYTNTNANGNGYANADSRRVTNSDGQRDGYFSLAWWHAGHWPCGDGDRKQK